MDEVRIVRFFYFDLINHTALFLRKLGIKSFISKQLPLSLHIEIYCVASVKLGIIIFSRF